MTVDKGVEEEEGSRSVGSILLLGLTSCREM